MTSLYLVFAGAAVIVALALLYGWRSRQVGRAQAGTEELGAADKLARKAGAIDEDVSRMPDDALFDELYDRVD